MGTLGLARPPSDLHRSGPWPPLLVPAIMLMVARQSSPAPGQRRQTDLGTGQQPLVTIAAILSLP